MGFHDELDFGFVCMYVKGYFNVIVGTESIFQIIEELLILVDAKEEIAITEYYFKNRTYI